MVRVGDGISAIPDAIIEVAYFGSKSVAYGDGDFLLAA
jgi:hypothetical protein